MREPHEDTGRKEDPLQVIQHPCLDVPVGDTAAFELFMFL